MPFALQFLLLRGAHNQEKGEKDIVPASCLQRFCVWRFHGGFLLLLLLFLVGVTI